MPIFEYRCPECERDFELLVRANEHAECPKCGSREVDKLLSAASAKTTSNGLSIASQCPPRDAPPCGPGCCRL